MTTLHNADPMTVYLLIDGEEPVAVPGIVDFNLTVENPEVHEERDDARRVNPRRAQQLRRRRRANPGDLNLTLDYDPCDWVHQELLAAGEADVRLTLRFAVRDGAGRGGERPGRGLLRAALQHLVAQAEPAPSQR